uniref:N-acetyltransferase domain-containing protein n=1 Tax=Chromera velia CCMP2878 TaxID=1169474 RepID=A0A0G4GWV2_9ALVE|eukprot:Cvel_5340.t1-p1 / transcript=Cvel_5340.t1 / gene=Cvel_5340 / organism=Chromera_velia_CCMP2878 / gene_product=hypothetical protein / transcript_product=hypothetical protein / location=Cvel_scaffold247:90211-91066(-) / protein_length=234 / sequence_SO=supercontig / SO=protein_coding / is_pseudo=false
MESSPVTFFPVTTREELEEAAELIGECFAEAEPLTVSDEGGNKEAMAQYVRVCVAPAVVESLEDGEGDLSWVAKDKKEGKIVAAFLAHKSTRKCPDLPSDAPGAQYFASVGDFFQDLHKARETPSAFEPEKTLKFSLACVHKDFRGHRLQRQGYQRSAEAARKRGYTCVFVEATSVASQKSVTERSTKIVAELQYASWRDSKGRGAFARAPELTGETKAFLIETPLALGEEAGG